MAFTVEFTRQSSGDDELVDCGWDTITATDLWEQAQLLGVSASRLLP